MLRAMPLGKPRHTREGPGDHCQQVIGHDVVAGIPGNVTATGGRKDSRPEKDLRDDRQKPHQRAKGKVAAVGQPFFQADDKHPPPDVETRQHSST